jgi:hypothetical protein
MDLVQNGNFEDTILINSNLFYTVGNSATQASYETDWTVDCAADSVQQCVGTNPILTVVFPGTATTNYGYMGQALYGPMPATDPGGGNVVAGNGDPEYNVSFSQVITGLTPGQSYLLTFYQAGAQEVGKSGATTDLWQVTLGSQTEDSPVMDTPSQGFTPWNEVDLVFLATSATEVLTFLSVGTPAGAPPTALLGDVALVQTTVAPEPSGLALLGVGVCALFAVRRFRRKRT